MTMYRRKKDKCRIYFSPYGLVKAGTLVKNVPIHLLDFFDEEETPDEVEVPIEVEELEETDETDETEETEETDETDETEETEETEEDEAPIEDEESVDIDGVIPGYSKMNVTAARRALDELSIEELESVFGYEEQNKNRKTVLNHILTLLENE